MKCKWPWTKKKTNEPEQPLNVGQSAEFDENSGTWTIVLEVIEKEIADIHTRNESLKLDESKTASLRGEIKALRKLANMPINIGRGNAS